MDLYALHVTRFQHCPPDGLRLQSSAAAADVLWGQVSHHGWEHRLKAQCDHLRQQWGNTVKGIKCEQLGEKKYNFDEVD